MHGYFCINIHVAMLRLLDEQCVAKVIEKASFGGCEICDRHGRLLRTQLQHLL